MAGRSQGTSAPVKMTCAAALYCLVHSFFASRAAKRAAGRILGAEVSNASYRALFNAQSLAGFAALSIYARGLPDRTLYKVKGSGALALRTLQISGLLWAVWTAREAGISELLGLKPILQMLAGRRPTLPEAQGPDMHERLEVRGPFLACRHPLNFAPLPVFWAAPRMTVNRLMFNILATAYLVLGSVHEENRLKAKYGTDYEGYIVSGVPFFVPDLWRLRLSGMPSAGKGAVITPESGRPIPSQRGTAVPGI